MNIRDLRVQWYKNRAGDGDRVPVKVTASMKGTIRMQAHMLRPYMDSIDREECTEIAIEGYLWPIAQNTWSERFIVFAKERDQWVIRSNMFINKDSIAEMFGCGSHKIRTITDLSLDRLWRVN